MRYNTLGKTGLAVSELCFGTMSFGDIADENASAEMFHACMDAGINIYDTADVYAGGESERILGRLIKGVRDELVIASKAYFPTGNGVNDRGSSRYHLIQAVEASLKRLQTDRIDLFYLHRFDEYTPLEETLRALDDLVRQGKILYVAVSNFSAWQTMKAIGLANQNGWIAPVAIQPMYNLVKRAAEIELLPMAESEGIGVFPYSPLGGGVLTGKYSKKAEKPASGRMVDNPIYTIRYAHDQLLAIADGMVEIANEQGVHPATLAVSWVASHPAVTGSIIGARHAEQLKPSLAAGEFEMSEELRARITALSPEPPPATDRNEESTDVTYGVRKL